MEETQSVVISPVETSVETSTTATTATTNEIAPVETKTATVNTTTTNPSETTPSATTQKTVQQQQTSTPIVTTNATPTPPSLSDTHLRSGSHSTTMMNRSRSSTLFSFGEEVHEQLDSDHSFSEGEEEEEVDKANKTSSSTTSKTNAITPKDSAVNFLYCVVKGIRLAAIKEDKDQRGSIQISAQQDLSAHGSPVDLANAKKEAAADDSAIKAKDSNHPTTHKRISFLSKIPLLKGITREKPVPSASKLTPTSPPKVQVVKEDQRRRSASISGHGEDLNNASFSGTGSAKALPFKKYIIPLHKDKNVRVIMKDYAPHIFMDIRKMCGISPSDYAKSWDFSLKDIPIPKEGAGRSGSLFMFSKDKRLMFKTIPPLEVQTVQTILTDYHHHLRTNPSSKLMRFFGLHRFYNPKDGSYTYLVVSNNIFYAPEFPIDIKYDLKGRKPKRGKALRNQDKDPKSYVFKDNDLNRSFFFDKETLEVVMKGLREDVNFLVGQNCMDYSLLIGIHQVTPEDAEKIWHRDRMSKRKLEKENERIERKQKKEVHDREKREKKEKKEKAKTDAKEKKQSKKDHHHHHKEHESESKKEVVQEEGSQSHQDIQSSTSLPDVQSNNQLNDSKATTNAEGEVHQTIENSAVVLDDHHREKSEEKEKKEENLASSKTPAKSLSKKMEKFTHITSSSSSSSKAKPTTVTAAAVRSLDTGVMEDTFRIGSLPEAKEIYYIGIIDFLSRYTSKKVAAHFFKTFLWEADTLSTVPALQYSNRYFNFVERILSSEMTTGSPFIPSEGSSNNLKGDEETKSQSSSTTSTTTKTVGSETTTDGAVDTVAPTTTTIVEEKAESIPEATVTIDSVPPPTEEAHKEDQ